MSNGCEHGTCIKTKLITHIKSSNGNRKKVDLKLVGFLFDANLELASKKNSELASSPIKAIEKLI